MGNPVTDSQPTGIASPRPLESVAQSSSSDRLSIISHGLLSPPLSVSPEAAFIAATAASQIVTNDHDNHAVIWYDQNGIEPAREAAVVSPAALKLVNSFLDQLLFSFVQVAKSPTLAALRPAVSQILKPKLAKDTIHNADEELREYLGGADENDHVGPRAPSTRDWDVELVWKRTRLRCMVYSSLGDLEEEDEDMYMEQENLEIEAHEQMSHVITPAVAIFLTSVIEYMGELTLTVAGQAAYHRVRAKFEKQVKDGTRNPADLADQIVVEEMDMERVALDRTLGRLWRGWRNKVRAPAIIGRSLSLSQPRQDSYATESHAHWSPVSEGGHDLGRLQHHLEDTAVRDAHPMNIPLPIGYHHVQDSRMPGLARQTDDRDDKYERSRLDNLRPKSLIIATSTANSPHTAVLDTALHRRSYSLPSPKRSLFYATARPNKTTGVICVAFDSSDTEEASEKQGTKREAMKPTHKTTSVLEEGRRPKSILKNDSDWDSEKMEVATYEKAEILTSSRVSVASTSSRSASDSGRALHMSRSSSVRSARIIDVPSPRSPCGSRPSSLDSTERPRPASLSSSSTLAQPFSMEEPQRSRTVEHGPRALMTASPTRPLGDRMRPPMQNATTISESEEDAEDHRPAKASVVVKSASSARNSDQAAHLPHELQADPKQTDRMPHSPKDGQASSSAKVAVLKACSLTSQTAEAQMPEICRKSMGHSNWQNPKSESKGMSAVERTRSEDTEEEVALPLHSIVPPRQIHTSGSSSSCATGRLKAVRASEDSSTRAESVARNFEELIQSNQTITYTLTPENMRDINVKPPLETPVVAKVTRKSEELRGSSSEANGSPLSQLTAPAPPQATIENKTKPAGPIPRAPAGVAVAPGRIGGPQARDARIVGESIADLAEFLKSTGPPGPVRVSSSPTKGSLDSRRVSLTSNLSNRNRYQPREAVVDNKADNSDLIDFIQQGPPGTASGEHRIPRHVAPFRNTMDSDMMSSAVGGKAIDAVLPEIRYSQASTNLTENSMPSMQSSVNSSSALLKNRGSSKPNTLFGEDDDMPVRKTRRVRDPYALDFSDEDEDVSFDADIRTPDRKEETLAEFLRNYEPPLQSPSPRSTKKLQKKSSAPSLIGRFTRNGGQSSATEARPLNSRTGSKGLGAKEPRSLISRSNSKHIPIQISIPPGYDLYGPINSSPGRPAVSSTPGSVGKVPTKKFEPREPVSSGQTSDLAAFLRNSGPPPDRVLPQASIHPEEGNGFSKMFGRRAKTTVT